MRTLCTVLFLTNINYCQCWCWVCLQHLPYSFLQGGTTLLMTAAYKGLKEVVSVLLDYGADIDMRNKVGPSKYHFPQLL